MSSGVGFFCVLPELFVGLDEGVSCFVNSSHFPLPTSIGGGKGIGTPEPASLASKTGCLTPEYE